MRILVFIFCVYLINVSFNDRVFEGELVYHHDIKINSKDYAQSKNFYDTLTITYKDKNYIKLTNKKDYEKILFVDSLRKLYVIYKDNLSKSKNLSMNEDNLNFGKLYNRENSHFGKIIAMSKSDTILNFDKEDSKFKKLSVEREYGFETYVYSNSEEFKLHDNRNILRNMGEQIHPEQIASELKNSILFYYKLNVKNADLHEEFKLVKILNKEIENSVFEIPKHKDAKGFKKENKKNGRFKFYQLTK